MLFRRGHAGDEERRSGDDRRVAVPGVIVPRSHGAPSMHPTVAVWPLDVPGTVPPAGRDAWASVVRQSMEHYRLGRADAAAECWTDDITWRLNGAGPLSGEHHGAEAVYRYHGRLQELTNGSFRQTLLAVEASNGPIVTAYLRTRARRGRRTLDIPTLVVFELLHLRIRRVTELPGDRGAWERFWA